MLQDGTASITTAATPLNGGTAVQCQEVLVQNDPASVANLLVGTAASQSIVVVPGASYVAMVTNAARVYVRAATGTVTVNWQARLA